LVLATVLIAVISCSYGDTTHLYNNLNTIQGRPQFNKYNEYNTLLQSHVKRGHLSHPMRLRFVPVNNELGAHNKLYTDSYDNIVNSHQYDPTAHGDPVFAYWYQ